MEASEGVDEESPILDHVFMGGQRDREGVSVDGETPHSLRRHSPAGKSRKYKKMLPEIYGMEQTNKKKKVRKVGDE